MPAVYRTGVRPTGTGRPPSRARRAPPIPSPDGMDDADLTDPAVAADYDLAFADRDAQVERLKTVLAGHLPVVEGGWLLDVACGSGLASEAASMLGYAVIGVDESPAMLALAAQRLPRRRPAPRVCRRDRAGHHQPRTTPSISVGNGLVLLPRERLAVALPRDARAATAGRHDVGDDPRLHGTPQVGRVAARRRRHRSRTIRRRSRQGAALRARDRGRQGPPRRIS